MSENNYKQKESIEEVVAFSFKDFFSFCFKKWYWFAICLAFSVGIALFYIYRTQPVFKRYEQILVKSQDSDAGVSGVANSFSSLGLFSKNSNVYNELLTIKSPAILYQVADSLKLYMNYSERDGLRYKTLYGTNQPFIVEMEGLGRQESGSFKMKRQPNGDMELYKFARIFPDGKVKYKDKISVKAGTDEINTPIGKIKITPNPRYAGEEEKEEKVYNISKMAMQSAVELYGLKMSGDLADEDADVIELTIEDVSVQRAVDILNSVIYFYNQNWIDDKNREAVASSNFIDDRLYVIQGELNALEKEIADYNKSLGTPSISETVKLNMEYGSKLEERYAQEDNQLTILEYMQDFLSNHDDITTILPINLGIPSGDLTSQISSYNNLVLNRNTIVRNSSETNPIAEEYAVQLQQLRTALLSTLSNRITNLKTSMATTMKEIRRNQATLADVPEVRLPIVSVERNRSIKQNLYMFLLQKKEENELTQKFSADNVRVITPPIGPLGPVAPRKALMIIVACIIGLGAPLVILYYLESSNTTIRSKKDLDSLKMSFAGEIPQVGKKANLKQFKSKLHLDRRKDEKPPLSVVEDGKRDVINEAFRVIRGNIDFMSGKNKDHQVVMITSFNPGSGKSFIAYNLGMSYALKNKKVLLIDCDLRHGSSSMYVGMPGKGLTAYLTGATEDWKSLIQTSSNPNLEILPIGKMPPNPAELLEDDRMANLVEQAKQEYDLVFLDCPPVNIVVDTQIIAPMADRTLFVVRAGLLERSALKELNEFYEEKKFHNISVILNGTEADRSRYYTYGNYQHLT